MDPSLECSYLSSTFTYTFDNITELQKKYPKDTCMKTESIPDISDLLNMNVYLEFYPCGGTESMYNYCSLYLHVSKRDNRPIKPRYFTFEWRIIDQKSGREDFSHEWCPVDDQCAASGLCYVFRLDGRGYGRPNFFNLLQYGKIVEQLKVKCTIKVFTEKTYDVVKKIHPDFENDPVLKYDTVMKFNEQSFDDNDEAIIKVKVGDTFELLKGSKRILTNASIPLAIRLEKEEWKGKDGQTYEIVGHKSILANHFIKSIHCGQLYGCDTLDGQLEMLKISDEYQVKWIKSEVSEIIKESLNIENILQCYFQSDQSSAFDLKEKCLNFCVENYKTIEATQEWKEFVANSIRLAFEVANKVALRRL